MVIMVVQQNKHVQKDVHKDVINKEEVEEQKKKEQKKRL